MSGHESTLIDQKHPWKKAKPPRDDGLLVHHTEFPTHDRSPPANVSDRAAILKRMEWFQVECRRLQEMLKRQSFENSSLKAQVMELTVQLGQAQAGMELADLVKRMTS